MFRISLRLCLVALLAVLLGHLGSLAADEPKDDKSTKDAKDSKDSKDSKDVKTDKDAKTDKDESLPEGAVARMGSNRFRHAGSTNINNPRLGGVNALVFMPDGKTLISAGSNEIRFWDKSGKLLKHITNNQNGWQYYSMAVSKDGKQLAACDDGGIKILNAETGKETTTLAGYGQCRALGFSADGKTLIASPQNQGFQIWDISKKTMTRNISNYCMASAIAPDGKVVAGASNDRKVHIWDTQTGNSVKEIAEKNNAYYYGVAIAFSPDSNFLAWQTQDGKLHLYDRKNDKESDFTTDNNKKKKDPNPIMKKGVRGQPGNAMAFSPDGKFLAVGGPGAVTIYGMESKLQLRQLEGSSTGNPYTTLAFSPDGKMLAAGTGYNQNTGQPGSMQIHVWDLENNKALHDSSGHEMAVHSVTFTADGKNLLTGSADRSIRIWDAATGKEKGRFEDVKDPMLLNRGQFPISSLSIAPDGKTVTSLHGNNQQNQNSFVGFWDLNSRKMTGKLYNQTHGYYTSVALSPDGQRVAISGYGTTINQALGQYDMIVAIHKTSDQKQEKVLDNTPINGLLNMLFSTDGEYLAGTNAQDQSFHVWSTQTGKVVREIPGNRGIYQRPVAFSPDGRLLAVMDSELHLMEVASWQERLKLKVPANQVTSAAFVKNSRVIALSGPEGVIYYDTITGKELARTKGTGSVNSLAAQGGFLATAGQDCTAFVWDVNKVLEKAKFSTKELASDALDGLWADLAKADKAHGAIGAFSGDPAKTVPFFKDRLKPVEQADLKKVAQLIKDLDDDKFETREKASEDLETMGSSIENELRKSLTNVPTPEVKKRVEQLLDKLTKQMLTADQLQVVRAVEVLEKIGSSEAQEVLKKMSGGRPGAKETEDARLALLRLTKK